MLGLPGCAERGWEGRGCAALGCAAARPRGARRCTGCRRQRRSRTDRQTDTHTQPPLSLPRYLPARLPLPGSGREEETSIPREEEGIERTSGFQAMPLLRQNRRWDKMGYKATRLAELFASGLRLLPVQAPHFFACS